MSKVFVISDTHMPFQNKKAMAKMLEHIKKEKPTHVIQIGDLLDQYVFSKYSRTLSITPEREISAGSVQARLLWSSIKRSVPKSKCYQLLGNHDIRLTKRIASQLPEMEMFNPTSKLYTFPGVKTMKSDRDFLVIDGVTYVHGWLSNSIAHARFFNGPVVHGHLHRPCIQYDNKKLWSMDVGYLADERRTPLQYTQSKHSKWTLACGVVENGQPRLIIL